MERMLWFCSTLKPNNWKPTIQRVSFWISQNNTNKYWQRAQNENEKTTTTSTAEWTYCILRFFIYIVFLLLLADEFFFVRFFVALMCFALQQLLLNLISCLETKRKSEPKSERMSERAIKRAENNLTKAKEAAPLSSPKCNAECQHISNLFNLIVANCMFRRIQ